MKTAELGDILKFDNKLVEVIGIADGKTIIMKPLFSTICDKCGEEKSIHVLENSASFQNGATPVKTIK